ncbi:hypothetical protein C8A05DRAFT_40215 [Staphylotrichum tortipilum]|uniref:Uncharacterized protein n=1 Tax=Staphylotrichum tortipilum TaxID=2831512 RepID=A0AAN6MTV5_9PEZI|nr:hypothetical protein C8A05DRAFT_40215 [Staphylotrichum longicolle]
MAGESSSSRPRGQDSARPSRRFAPPETIVEESEQREPHEGKRVEIDGDFVQFLFDYAANAAECPPLFKAFLEGVVLKPGSGDLMLRVQAYFRNPQIKDYSLGPTFLRELEKYTAYDQLYHGTGPEGHLAPIPKRYQPRTPGSLSQLSSQELADIEPGAVPPDEVVTRLGVHDGEEPPTEPERKADQTGPDWETDSWYKGRRQPPLAVRLNTIINFLADEDVDRCIDWAAKFGEIVDYLEWLALVDERRQLDNAGLQTQAMFSDAVAKAKAHALFERHHSIPTTLEVARRQHSPPLRSTRLDGMRNGHGWLLQSRNTVPDRSDLLPQPIPPRLASPVNMMLVDRPTDGPIYQAFIDDERGWWQNPAGEDLEGAPLPQANLAEIETETFNSFLNHGEGEGESNPGWVRTDPATGQAILPDGVPLQPGDPESWARERGARRAGLQQLLRAFPTGLPVELDTRWRRPVLATPATALRRACEAADNPQWPLPTLDRDQLPEELETMPQTVAYHDRLAHIKVMREMARLRVENQHRHEQAVTGRQRRGWVAVPRNVVNGGPYVWRMADADDESVRDLLKQCCTTVDLLKAAYRREPRPLLEAVLEMLDRADWGEFAKHTVPGDVTLAGDEWARVGKRRMPKLIKVDDEQWLRFLAGECVNRANWARPFVPDAERDKNRLFLIFAVRMQKLLDDKNPEGLFSRHDAQVEVDSLLPVINAGKGSSNVTKYEFQPSEACRWLDKLKESGHVRFYLDPACYGVVKRPEAECFPEHRVLWPTAADTRERPSYHLGYVSDWRSVIQDGRTPDISEGSPIWNFFLSLAFRLGYTIYQLKLQERSAARAPRPSRQNLRTAIGEWEHASSLFEAATPEPTEEELAAIRTAIIDEASANETMLAPGRARRYFDAAGNRHTVLERDHHWDWASLPAQNRTRRRQFWSVDRWPLGAGQLSDAAERAVREDAHLDLAMTYDPVEAAGPIDERYTRPKLRPYREEKVIFREGPAVYPVGDTRLQREALQERMTEMVAIEMGLDTKLGSRFGILANLNPFSRPSSRAGAGKEPGSLPPADPRRVPRSWDPVAEAERREQERLEAERPQAEGGDEDDT